MSPGLSGSQEMPERSERVAQQLRDLPSELASPFDFGELRSRAARIRTRRTQRMLVAAGLALSLTGTLLHHYAIRQHETQRARTLASGVLSPNIERAFANGPEYPVVVDVSTQLAIADLEDRVASMDDALNEARIGRAPAPRMRALQQRRAQLIDTLALVRAADTTAAQLP